MRHHVGPYAALPTGAQAVKTDIAEQVQRMRVLKQITWADLGNDSRLERIFGARNYTINSLLSLVDRLGGRVLVQIVEGGDCVAKKKTYGGKGGKKC